MVAQVQTIRVAMATMPADGNDTTSHGNQPFALTDSFYTGLGGSKNRAERDTPAGWGGGARGGICRCPPWCEAWGCGRFGKG